MLFFSFYVLLFVITLITYAIPTLSLRFNYAFLTYVT